MVYPYSLFSDFDLNLFSSGHHSQLYNKFGSHVIEHDEKKGVYFSVYAPAARKVEVIGDFNYWSGENHELLVRWDGSGIWEGFIPGVSLGDLYKYRIYSNNDYKVREKADPYARKFELPPRTASVVWNDDYKWKADQWDTLKQSTNKADAPISIYELHLGSWKKNDDGHSLTYRELAKDLVEYVVGMGYTHVEFMPVMEHPYYPSWGYLCTGFFAPTSRYGNPDELKFLIDAFHKMGIGVYFDWVPAHFPEDEYALADFDGSCIYEHPERSKGYHPDWKSLIFNYERPQIRSFLLSSAHFWCSVFNIDGLRVDAVASMLYLDYSREEGEWSPNIFGGNQYLAAVDFLKELNTTLYRDFPDLQMIAEESTAFNGVTHPVHDGGLGFGLKWMMGWMNDTLEFFERDPIHRSHHHNDISRSLTYAFSENYALPLSHDEVVHGKKSLIYKMPGDEWQQFANLRLLYTYMYTHPGSKLLFMGGEIAQTSEWDVNESLPWHLLQYNSHKGIQNTVRALNEVFKGTPSLYEKNYQPDGFSWIDYNDKHNSVLTYLRSGHDSFTVIILNFSPEVRHHYRIGIPSCHHYSEIFNSDSDQYWGSNVTNEEKILVSNLPSHGYQNSIEITIPPLAGIMLKPIDS